MGVQAHMGVQANTQGVQAHTQGVSRSKPGGFVSACTEADSPQQTATAAGGTHPTVMHSC